MFKLNNSTFKTKALAILLVTQAFILFTPLPSYSLHVAESTAMTAKDSIFLFDKDRTKLFILYRAEGASDVPIYGQLLNFTEPYRAQNVQTLPYAVSKYGTEAAKFLKFAPDAPEWNLHNWLSYEEYHKLANDLRVQGINIVDIKELPFIALIAPEGRLSGQWKGCENFTTVRQALKSLGYSAAEAKPNSTSIGDDFVNKTEPIYQKKLTLDENERSIIGRHFIDSGLRENQMKPYGGQTKLNKLSDEMKKEPQLAADIRKGIQTCGNYYLLEVKTDYNEYKHLYCISNNEAKLISSHSKRLDQIETFIEVLYQGRQSISKQEIMSQSEKIGYDFDIFMFLGELTDKKYDKNSLVREINNNIKKSGRMNDIGGLLREL